MHCTRCRIAAATTARYCCRCGHALADEPAENAAQAVCADDRFRTYFEQAPNGIFVTDEHGRCVEVNSAACRLSGYDEAELLALGFADLLPPEALPAAQETFARVRVVGRICTETPFVGKRGRRGWWRVDAVRISNTRIISFVIDVSELREYRLRLEQSEAKFRAIFDAEPECVKLIDAQARLIDMNRAGLEMIEAESLEQVRHADTSEVVAPQYREQYLADVAEVFRGLRTASEFETVGLRGTRRWMEQYAVGLPDVEDPGHVGQMLAVTRDITARKQAEAELRAAAEVLRNLILHTPAGVAMLDRELRYLACSKRWLSDYRLEEAAVLGRGHYEVFPEIPERWREIHRRCLAGEAMRCDEDRFERADGAVEYLRWEIQPWREASGEVGGLCFFTELITARKQAEQSLQNQLRLFDHVLRHTFDCLVLLDDRYDFVRVNQAFADVCGLEAEELVGRNCFEMFPSSLKDDFDEAIRTRTTYRTTTKPIDFPERSERGVTYWDLAMAPIYDADDRLELILFTLRDVTEHQRNLDRLRLHSQVLVAMTEAVCFIDDRGLIQFTNGALDALFGYAGGELIGRPVADLNDYASDENARVVEEVMTAMKTAGAWSGEFRNRRRDGTVFWTAARISAIVYQDSPYFVSVQHDVTAKKRSEEEAASLRGQLAHAGRVALIGEMASGLAHELNQPLAALQLYAGLASEDARSLGSDRLSGLLRRIGEQIVRANDIIRGMRSFAKRETMNRSPTDANRLIREVLPLLNHDLRKHEVELRLALDERLPLVMADAIQIQQVLANLIRNAVDAMSADECRPRTLRIYSEVAPQGVGIGVVDTGGGIRPEMAEHLFQPFHTDKPSGLGLGLAISRTLIEAHGGWIEARNNPSRGSTFYFVIPAAFESTAPPNL